jgi:hypothetical protein
MMAIQYKWAESTNDAYNRRWQEFRHFCTQLHLSYLPAKPKTVERFLTHMILSKQGASLRKAKASIARVHKVNGFADPTKEETVSFVISGGQKYWARYQRKKQDREPFPAEAGQQWARLKPKGVPYLRWMIGRVLSSSIIRAMLRPGETQDLLMKDVTFDHTRRVATFNLWKHKMDQSGFDGKVPLEASTNPNSITCPYNMLVEWVNIRKSQGARRKDPLFCSHKGGQFS